MQCIQCASGVRVVWQGGATANTSKQEGGFLSPHGFLRTPGEQRFTQQTQRC